MASSNAFFAVLNVEENAPYYFCQPDIVPPPNASFTGTYSLHYVIDPTGWGVQIGAPFSHEPSGCSSSVLLDWSDDGNFNPACNLGLC